MSDDLRAKYGADAFDTGIKMQGKAFEQRLAQRDAIDQHFTRAWLDYQIKGLSRRPALDTRTRFLVLIGQYTMAKSQPLLEDTVRAALAAKVAVREIAEIILQCQVYGGLVTVDPAIRTFHKIAEELNLLPDLKKTQLPLDGTDSKRNRAEEEKSWHKDDVADPRTKPLIDKHGWLAVSSGTRPISRRNRCSASVAASPAPGSRSSSSSSAAAFSASGAGSSPSSSSSSRASSRDARTSRAPRAPTGSSSWGSSRPAGS